MWFVRGTKKKILTLLFEKKKSYMSVNVHKYGRFFYLTWIKLGEE